MMEEKNVTKVVHSILLASAVVGNILVCLVILKISSFRTPVYYLMMNLAIADLMIVFSFTSRHILEGLYHHPSGTVGAILCKTITSDTFTWVGAVASSITLVVIAYVERFAAVTAPLENRFSFSIKKSKIAVAFCWTVAMIFNIPLFYVRNLNRERGFRESHWPSVAFALDYNVTWLALVGVLSSCLMVFFYGKVIVKLRQEVIPRRHASMAVIKARKNVTKMLTTVTVLYGICWIPNLILYVVWYFVLDAHVMYTINKVFLFLILVNSCINPIVYAVQNRLFRRRMADIVCKCKKWPLNQNHMSTIFQTSGSSLKNSTIQLVRFTSRRSHARELEFCNLE